MPDLEVKSARLGKKNRHCKALQTACNAELAKPKILRRGGNYRSRQAAQKAGWEEEDRIQPQTGHCSKVSGTDAVLQVHPLWQRWVPTLLSAGSASIRGPHVGSS